MILNSAIGGYDGNAYEALFAAAQNSPLNRHEVTPGYEANIRPLIKARL